jgi:ATP-dependent helicase Lhr and Lhr-like helicase
MRQLRACSSLFALALMRVELAAPSPFALPLRVERLPEQLGTEKLKDRLERSKPLPKD